MEDIFFGQIVYFLYLSNIITCNILECAMLTFPWLYGIPDINKYIILRCFMLFIHLVLKAQNRDLAANDIHEGATSA